MRSTLTAAGRVYASDTAFAFGLLMALPLLVALALCLLVSSLPAEDRRPWCSADETSSSACWTTADVSGAPS